MGKSSCTYYHCSPNPNFYVPSLHATSGQFEEVGDNWHNTTDGYVYIGYAILQQNVSRDVLNLFMIFICHTFWISIYWCWYKADAVIFNDNVCVIHCIICTIKCMFDCYQWVNYWWCSHRRHSYCFVLFSYFSYDRCRDFCQQTLGCISYILCISYIYMYIYAFKTIAIIITRSSSIIIKIIDTQCAVREILLSFVSLLLPLSALSLLLSSISTIHLGQHWHLVMACCLTATSHYLNECWLIIGEVRWQSPERNVMRDTSIINY